MGIASCTDLGRAKPSLSCFRVFCKVLIKLQSLLYRGMIQGLGIEIFRVEHQPLGTEELRTDKGQDEAFKGHAVVGKKAAQGEGKGGQDTHPADLSGAHHIAQAEVYPHRHQHGQQGE